MSVRDEKRIKRTIIVFCLIVACFCSFGFGYVYGYSLPECAKTISDENI